jgi:Concanavalin A-like lectin/glucanases superfamily
MIGRGVAIVAAAVLAVTLSPGSASAGVQSDLGQIMMGYQPLVYWPLDDLGAPATGYGSFKGSIPLNVTGSGPALTWNAASHPGGGSPASVRFNPKGPRSGQYLRSQPDPVGEKQGSIVIWFRLGTVPTWQQALAVDNGAWSQTGGGLMISKDGHLLSEDVTGFIDYRSKARLTVGTWHCAVWTDTYSPKPNPSGSTLYLDGYQLTNGLGDVFPTLLSVPGARLLLGDGGPGEVKGIGRFRGNISNVAIYDGPLSPAAVANIWFDGGPV